MKLPKIETSGVIVCFAMAVLFSLCFNIDIATRLYKILSEAEKVSAGFVISIPLLFLAFFNAVFCVLLVGRRVWKGVFIILVLLSSTVAYAGYQYGIVFDDDMLRNFMETNPGEAMSYFNASLVAWVVLTGFLPSFLIFITEIRPLPFKTALLQRAVSIVVSFAVVGVIAALYYQDYAATVRNNVVLKKTVVPNYAIENIGSVISDSFSKNQGPRVIIGDDAEQVEDKGKDLVVIVVGETQRAMNYSLGGYARETNPFTKARDVIYFNNVTSCGTATAVSVPCMFSFLGRKNYAKDTASNEDNLIDVIAYAGDKILWIDNDAGCKGVCAKAEYVDVRTKYAHLKQSCDDEGCHDGVVAEELKSRTDELAHNYDLVVLHMMGSHGPTYWKRYPKEHAKFLPDCPRSDIQNCTAEELVNTYDNTIYYEDKVLGDIIDTLDKVKNRNIAMIFISDHGESLGEKGLYLHGLPYALAPKEQTSVPMMVWMSKSFIDHEKDEWTKECLEERARTGSFSHDNLAHSVLELLDIETTAYREDLNIFRACK